VNKKNKNTSSIKGFTTTKFSSVKGFQRNQPTITNAFSRLVEMSEIQQNLNEQENNDQFEAERTNNSKTVSKLFGVVLSNLV
jgi:hypothetical protein